MSVAVSRELVEIWRTDDCAAYESVYLDQNGVICTELVIWDKDGNRYREVIGGVDLTTIRRDWAASSPYSKMLLPDDSGQKVWTNLEPEAVAAPTPEPPAHVPASERLTAPEPEAAPTPEPAVPAAIERPARTLAIQVHQLRVARQSDLFLNGIPVDAEAWLSYAISEQWILQDADGRYTPGPVSPYLPDENDKPIWPHCAVLIWPHPAC